MRLRRIAPHVAALALGVGAAVLVACGGSGTEAGIPPASAELLKDDFEDVRQAVESGRCDDVGGQLRQLGERVDNLPQSVDNELQERLRDAVNSLQERAIEECNDNEADEPTTTTTEEQVPEEVPTVTETTPTTTTEVPPETTPPETTPVEPPTTTPTAPPLEPPPDAGIGDGDGDAGAGAGAGGTPPRDTP